MSGTAIIGALLRADQDLGQLFAPERIMAGRLPAGAELPVLLIRTESEVQRQPLSRAGWVRLTARIGVTVRAATYRDQERAMRLVRAACAGRTGTIADCPAVAVRNAGLGPDVDGPNNTFEQTRDFRVGFDAPA